MMSTPLNTLAKRPLESELKPTTVTNLSPSPLTTYIKSTPNPNMPGLGQGTSSILNFAFNGDSSPQLHHPQLTAIAVPRDIKQEGGNPVTSGQLKNQIILLGKNPIVVTSGFSSSFFTTPQYTMAAPLDKYPNIAFSNNALLRTTVPSSTPTSIPFILTGPKSSMILLPPNSPMLNSVSTTTVASNTFPSSPFIPVPVSQQSIPTTIAAPLPIKNLPLPPALPAPEVTRTSVATSTMTTLEEEDGLMWKDGIGSLPGSNIKFAMNEFGSLEIVQNNKEHQLSENKPNNNCIVVPSQENCVGLNLKKCEPAILQEDATQQCSVCQISKRKDEFFKDDFCSEVCFRKKSPIKKPKPILPKTKKRKSEGDEEAIPLKKVKPVSVPNHFNLESSFSWAKYLRETNSEAAPNSLFRDTCQGIISCKNYFKKGMRLEGTDPKHPSMFCVLSVSEVRGPRIKLHFDSYGDQHDFWVNVTSKDIFPAGWCNANHHTLSSPQGYENGNFEWSSYLKEIKATAAPKEAFVNQIKPSYNTHLFKKNQKLEAVDKSDTKHALCVATVGDVMEDRFLIHFDEWHDVYDYWAKNDSPYIHPINWSKENNHDLIPPNNYNANNFDWDRYLQKTKSTAVPLKAYKKKRPPNSFSVGMKLEAVDKRSPNLIRVATVCEVESYMIRLHYDNFLDTYDVWVEDDSPDIHPISWCQSTGHPLEIPPEPLVSSQASHFMCSPTGCQGFGHLQLDNESDEDYFLCTLKICPYSQDKLDSESSSITDRLDHTIEEMEEDDDEPEEQPSPRSDSLRKCPTSGCDGSGNIVEKYAVHHGVASCPLSDKKITNGHTSPEPTNLVKNKPGRKSKRLGRSSSPENSNEEVIYIKESNLRKIVEDSFNHGYPFQDAPSQELCYGFYANTILDPILETLTEEEVREWTSDQVASLVVKITNSPTTRDVIEKHKLDGVTFLLLTHDDLITYLKLKMGIAAKISSAIRRIRYNEYYKRQQH